jgi:enamine deaminase RidA (YjgF/YER057c/UK114 family)
MKESRQAVRWCARIVRLMRTLAKGARCACRGGNDPGQGQAHTASVTMAHHPRGAIAMLERFDVGPRMSEMTVHNKVAYLSGQIPEDTSQDITGQTRQVLAEIDKLLALVASDKQHVLRAEVFLADINDFAGMNAAWDEWVVAGMTPARATVEAKLADPSWKVEIVITAALP